MFEIDDIVTTINYKGIGVVTDIRILGGLQVVEVKEIDGVTCVHCCSQLVNLSDKLRETI